MDSKTWEGISPKVIFWLGVLVSIETAIGGGTLSLTNTIPPEYIPRVQAWCNLLAFIGSTAFTALSGYASRGPGPLLNAPTTPPIVKSIALFVAIGGLMAAFLLATASPAAAQSRANSLIQNIAKKNDVNAPGGAPGAQEPLGQGAEQAIDRLKADALADLKYAAALADARGNKVTAACWHAWVDLIEGFNQPLKDANGNVMPEPKPDMFTGIEKVSQLRQALSNGGPIQTGCAPLKDAANTDLKNLIGMILGGGAGIAKLIPIIP